MALVALTPRLSEKVAAGTTGATLAIFQ